MTKFTTRVELHDADSDDYDRLHDAMKAKGFSRFIKDHIGNSYHLPSAEYNFTGTATIDEVLNKAKAAAKETGLTFEILVTESNGRRWLNLDPA
ncbi:type V toxin-antitoxin system endoribonuclease antitoxin GhoS [Burkholderia multivorans]|uniref:type V toxin-antitoxin system endoribonuclease antitoxin GhoS n=1 Tax=Burkholderia multivorans TaxID=87883 RepID=UPI0009B6DAA1|nr:type V toxin-antitoxin system endoribonuclease antitoxin GhoS [Burkholderia multivorans]MBU9318290.1 type V toxin-antitoxin system endoribonuclease antitoxin GhoS [Burkholderia multivorans]MCA8376387.1 type V toxin-antitoxin system endoribonuclease antitoxin GhoS [Burkholderia multivorans]MCL4625332.1 type V toxin-antitoxin system endoribonuclease antitoxin GhoS [Burkholderia multivorans]MCO1371097.1 type V toxin-antitoxin system endoribonuclease antitoxin GhoS [Burkholderia multivorans]MCO